MKPTSGYRRPEPGTQPNYFHSAYVSSLRRAPKQPLISLPDGITEYTGPRFSPGIIPADAFDLTTQHHGQPLGERIAVGGRVLDEDGRPVPNSLVEIWQANASGRYLHKVDQHDAPLDPNFTGRGQTFTDRAGRYLFVTIRPGAYPWRNHANAWRPQHIHFSLFGPAFATRLVTQMYFPGDPLLAFDPIFNSVPSEAARQRLVSAFDWDMTTPESSLGFRFDIVLRGRNATPMER
jgi:protocatechuate 3,4-dioxygenase beta subunit